MPSKKKKYNARFPAGRIKKIMQSDEEVGKVAQAVPIIISRTLELFVESLLTKTLKITNSRNAKTLSTSHMKQCIMSEQRFDFLRELVRNIPDISVAEESATYNEEDNHSSPDADSDTPYDLSMPSTSSARQMQSYQSNGQNGGLDYQKNYLKRSISSNSNSVIMHTTSSLASAGIGYNSADCLPAKFSRSDSTPIPPSQQNPPLTSQQHPRLKHQSLSMPSNCVTNTNNNNKPNIPPSPPSQPTAPIVSIDYCNKPMVKIDYSNLQMPLSAPAHMSSMSSANFTAEPVINIDLSNIVAASNVPTATPAVATISIGSLAKNSSTQQSRNSKASMANPFITSSTSSNVTTSLANSNPCLELDEDYDNI
ncbi:negative cofactor 2 alpha [Haematobia irritans]|uniref:negative cofactor 2 alpha n=1 Tax=Haematobia irritans TaxID=7368 RepID=UPI003F4F7746